MKCVENKSIKKMTPPPRHSFKNKNYKNRIHSYTDKEGPTGINGYCKIKGNFGF